MKIARPLILFLMVLAGLVFYAMALAIVKILGWFDDYRHNEP